MLLHKAQHLGKSRLGLRWPPLGSCTLPYVLGDLENRFPLKTDRCSGNGSILGSPNLIPYLTLSISLERDCSSSNLRQSSSTLHPRAGL